MGPSIPDIPVALNSVVRNTSGMDDLTQSHRTAPTQSSTRRGRRIGEVARHVGRWVNIRLTGVHRYCLRGPVPGVANIALGGQQ